MASNRRKRAGRPRSNKARHPGGQVVRDTTLPPPEVVARRGANWQDQDAGCIFGIMQARGCISVELKVAGQNYSALVASYERLIGAPVCATPTDGGGRTLTADDPTRYARVRAQMAASLAVLRRLDHGCLVGMARAAAAVTHEQIADAVRWIGQIIPALHALHDACDDIKRAGQRAADAITTREAA